MGDLSLILVRNTVRHDARVLREAATLRDLGYEVLIAGVVSTSDQAKEMSADGFRVVRLDPGGGARRLVRLARAARARAVVTNGPAAKRGTRAVAKAAAGGDHDRTRPTAAPMQPDRCARARARRIAITLDYYRQGIALVHRLRPALVHANDYNTMWIGMAAKLLTGSRLVYDCHELWADRNERPEWRPWLIACEAAFVRVADAVITASPGYGAAIAARYRVPPPTVIRNIPPSSVRLERASAGADSIVYVGGLMPGRGLEQAIAALALAPGARLRLLGPGSAGYRDSLAELARRLRVLDRVAIEDPVAPAAVIDVIASANAGLLLIEPICRSYELTLPNKLFEYAAAGLPILASDLTVIGPLVRAHGLGELVPPHDVEAIAAAMRRLLVPAVNARVREHVRAYAAAVTWDAERAVLERIYAGRRA